VVAVEKLGKRFAGRWVFRNLGFELNQGDALLVVGPNGSGKSTLLKVIAGLMMPSAGVVHLPEGDARRILGYAALDLNLYPHLTVQEHLTIAAELRGCEPRLSELTTLMDLEAVSQKPALSLSSGMKARLKLALALQARPELLLLDEPGASLDERGRAIVRRICTEHRNHGIAIIATNDPTERDLGNLILELG
jgi:ABC-type multidrug transport system ATPase subunit